MSVNLAHDVRRLGQSAYFCDEGGGTLSPSPSSPPSSSPPAASDPADSPGSEDVPGIGRLQPPGPDGKCPEGQQPFFYKAGCNNAVTPLCTPDGPRHACLGDHCGCDGVTFRTFCNQTEKPYAFFGACETAAPKDAGPD